MLLVWSGLVFIAVRDRAFLAYFAYVATFGVYMAVNTGFAFQYFWPDSPGWANTCLIVLLSLAMITALEFSTTILRARDYAPRMERIARGLQILGLVLIVLIAVPSLRGAHPADHVDDLCDGDLHDRARPRQPDGGFAAGALLRDRLGRISRRLDRLPVQELWPGAAHLHEPAQLAGRRAAGNDPAVDDAESSHERVENAEPHRPADAAGQSPPVRRSAAHRVCAGARRATSAVVAHHRHRQLQGLQRPARSRARRRGHQAGGRGVAPPRPQAGVRLSLRRR